jgi:hypothetical protein
VEVDQHRKNMTEQGKTPQWAQAFPAPRSKVSEMTADDVMKLFDDMDLTPEPRSFLLVDVRRDDWEVRIGLCLRVLSYLHSPIPCTLYNPH